MSFAPPKPKNTKTISNAKIAIRRNNLIFFKSKCIADSQGKNSLKNSTDTDRKHSLRFPLPTSKVPVFIESKSGGHSKNNSEVSVNGNSKKGNENPKDKIIVRLNSRIVCSPKEDKANVHLLRKKSVNFKRNSLTESNLTKNACHTATIKEKENTKLQEKHTALQKTSLRNKSMFKGISMNNLSTHHSLFANEKKLTGEGIYGSSALAENKKVTFKTASMVNINKLCASSDEKACLKNLKHNSKRTVELATSASDENKNEIEMDEESCLERSIGVFTKSSEIYKYEIVKINKAPFTKENINYKSVSHYESSIPLKEYEDLEDSVNEGTYREIVINKSPFQSDAVKLQGENCKMLIESTNALMKPHSTIMSTEIESFRILPDTIDTERLQKKQNFLQKQITDISLIPDIKYRITNNEQYSAEQTVQTVNIKKGRCDIDDTVFKESRLQNSQMEEILPEYEYTCEEQCNKGEVDGVQSEMRNIGDHYSKNDKHGKNEVAEAVYIVKKQSSLSNKVDKTTLTRRDMLEKEINEKIKILTAEYLQEAKARTKRTFPTSSVKKRNTLKKFCTNDVNYSQSPARAANHATNTRNAAGNGNTERVIRFKGKTFSNERNDKTNLLFNRSLCNTDVGDLKMKSFKTMSFSPKEISYKNYTASPKASKIPRSINCSNTPSGPVSPQNSIVETEHKVCGDETENKNSEDLREFSDEITALFSKEVFSNNAGGDHLNNSNMECIISGNEGFSQSLSSKFSEIKDEQKENKEDSNAKNVSPTNKNDDEFLRGTVKDGNHEKEQTIADSKVKQWSESFKMPENCNNIFSRFTEEKVVTVTYENQSQKNGRVESLNSKRVAHTKTKSLKDQMLNKFFILLLSFFTVISTFFFLKEVNQ